MGKPTIKQIKGMRKACKALAQYLYMRNKGVAGMDGKQVKTSGNVGLYYHNNIMWVITINFAKIQTRRGRDVFR